MHLSIISHKESNTSETEELLDSNICQGKHEGMYRFISYHQAVLYNTRSRHQDVIPLLSGHLSLAICTSSLSHVEGLTPVNK